MKPQYWIPIFFVVLCTCGKLTEPRKDPLPTAPVATSLSVQRLNPDFTTYHGIKVWTHGAPVTKDKMDEASEFFAIFMFNEAGVPVVFTTDLLKNFTVEWSTDLATLGEPEPKGSRKVQVLWTGSIASSALFHEWMHCVLFATQKDADAEHKDRWWEEILPEMKEKAADEGL